MRRGGQSKKGISPLVATVLLIAFAITIGALIMGWGQGLIEGSAETAKSTSDREIFCTVGTSLQVKVVAGEKKLCYRNVSNSQGRIDFMLENNGDKQVSGIRMVIVGETDENEVYDLDNLTIIGGGVKKGTQTYNMTVLGNVTQVEFIPKVISDSASVPELCSNRRLQEDGIFECT
jgi:flagellin-like protein